MGRGGRGAWCAVVMTVIVAVAVVMAGVVQLTSAASRRLCYRRRHRGCRQCCWSRQTGSSAAWQTVQPADRQPTFDSAIAIAIANDSDETARKQRDTNRFKIQHHGDKTRSQVSPTRNLFTMYYCSVFYGLSFLQYAQFSLSLSRVLFSIRLCAPVLAEDLLRTPRLTRVASANWGVPITLSITYLYHNIAYTI